MKADSINLFDSLTPEAQRVIADDSRWSKKYMMESCALCGKKFSENCVPLHLWKHDGHWSISLHMKCAFGDKFVEPEEDV